MSRTDGLVTGLLIGLVFLLTLSRLPAVMVDDAFISFRYARNLSAGYGLVYNPGERVEGYSNLSWVLLAAIVDRLGGNVPAVMRWAGAGFGLAALILLAGLARRELPGWWFALPPLLAAASPQFVMWSAAGLEVPLFAAALLALLLLLAVPTPRRLAAAVPVACLLVLTRPEGILYAAVAALLLWRDQRVSSARLLSAWLLPLLAAVLGYHVWRYWYFGDLLGNVYYAKLGLPLGARLADGIAYLLRYCRDFWIVPALLPGFFLALSRGGTTIRRSAVFVLLGVCFILLAGGDHAVYYRFAAPLVPLYYLAGLAGYEPLLKRFVINVRGHAMFPLAGVLFCLALAPLFAGKTGMNEFLYGEARVYRDYRLIGSYFATRKNAGEILSIATAGIIPYVSELYTIDSYGLTNPDIARTPFAHGAGGVVSPGHIKSNPEYIMARCPDYILGMPVLWPEPEFSESVADITFGGTGDYRLHNMVAARKDYALQCAELDGRYLFYYRWTGPGSPAGVSRDTGEKPSRPRLR